MATFTALYDACVLYPASLADLLMHLAMTGLFRARWTDEIHEEWISALLKKRPDLGRAKLERRRDLMNLHAQDCLVTGYEPLALLAATSDLPVATVGPPGCGCHLASCRGSDSGASRGRRWLPNPGGCPSHWVP